jgi:hypothetical protein
MLAVDEVMFGGVGMVLVETPDDVCYDLRKYMEYNNDFDMPPDKWFAPWKGLDKLYAYPFWAPSPACEKAMLEMWRSQLVKFQVCGDDGGDAARAQYALVVAVIPTKFVKVGVPADYTIRPSMSEMIYLQRRAMQCLLGWIMKMRPGRILMRSFVTCKSNLNQWQILGIGKATATGFLIEFRDVPILHDLFERLIELYDERLAFMPSSSKGAYDDKFTMAAKEWPYRSNGCPLSADGVREFCDHYHITPSIIESHKLWLRTLTTPFCRLNHPVYASFLDRDVDNAGGERL